MSESGLETTDVGYYPDFPLRVARSEGYAAGSAGLPMDRHIRFSKPYRYSGAELDAWNEGWQRGSEILAICPPPASSPPPVAKPEVEVKRTVTTLF